MNQKSKNQLSKKSKNTTSQQNLTKEGGALRKQLQSLKQQLNNLKDKKENHNNGKQIVKKQQKGIQAEIFELQQINYKSKDKKLKLDIEINKLKKLISKGDRIHISSQINNIFSIINLYNEQIQSESIKNTQFYQKIQKQFDEYVQKNENQIYKEKYKGIIKLNKKLQNQVMELRHRITLGLQLQIGKKQFMNKFQQQYVLISKENKQLTQNNERLREVINNKEIQIQALKQQIKIFQRQIENKQSQIIVTSQSMNYLKIQMDRLKNQNRSLSNQIQSINKINKQLIKQKQIIADQLEIVKKKLKKQEQLRIMNDHDLQKSNNIHKIQEKQIQQLKKNNHSLNKQLKQLRQNFNSEKQRIRKLQTEFQKLGFQKKNLLQNLQQSNYQIENLMLEIDHLKKANENYKDLYMKTRNRDYKQKEEQSKTFQQIQKIIQKHKTSQYLQIQ